MIVQSFLRKKSVPNGTSRAGRLILQSDISELCWSPAKWPKFPECFFFSILHTIQRWNLPAGFIHILCYFRAISQDSWISFPSYFSETVQESWRSQDSRRFCLLLKTDSSDYFEEKKILLLISSILLIITLISLHYLSDWCCKFHFCLLLSKIYGIYHFLLWWCTALTIMNHFSLVFQFLSNSFLYIFSTFKNPIGVYHPCLISYGYNKSIPNQASLFHSKIHNDNTSISDRSIS